MVPAVAPRSHHLFLDRAQSARYKREVIEPGLGYGMAAFLGALQGVAEFLPISSSGHLSLAQAWFDIDPASAGHTFNIVVHAGTLLAVLLVFGRDLIELVRGIFQPERVPWARPLFAAIVVASAPLLVVLLPGVEDRVVRMESQVRWIGAALLLTAALLGFSHRKFAPVDDPLDPPSPKRALAIGLAQLVAVLPGVSRSGSTIAAGLALGLGRARAARFSFLISIPAVGAATLKEAVEVGASGLGQLALGPLVLGFAVSFVVGLASLRLLLRLIQRVGMWPFVPYLVVLGTAALIIG